MNSLRCKDLEAPKKTSKNYELKFKKDGVPVDITDWIIYFTVKENMADADDNAKIKKDITSHYSPTNGITIIELSVTDLDLPSRSYWYDIKYKDNEGNAGILYSGRFRVGEPVTQRG